MALFMKFKNYKSTLYKGVNKKVVQIPEGVTYIYEKAFEGCDKIEELILPSTINRIDNFAFKNCTSLKKVEFVSDSDSDNTKHITINLGAFEGCESLKEVIMPNRKVDFGDDIFKGCTSLNTIDISGASIAYGLGFCIFEGCFSLNEVILPNDLEKIPAFTFKGCSSMWSINIPESVAIIGIEAFCGCSNLDNLNLPENLKDIQDRAFFACKLPKKLKLPSQVYHIGQDAFRYSELEEIELSENLKIIGDSAFRFSKLKKIILNESLERIDNSAFLECHRLSSLKINNIKSIGKKAFEGCHNLNLEIGTSLFDFEYDDVNNNNNTNHNPHDETTDETTYDETTDETIYDENPSAYLNCFDVQSLTIYGHQVNVRSASCISEINVIRRIELRDIFIEELKRTEFSNKLKGLLSPYLQDHLETKLSEYIELIIASFGKGTYDYETDFKKYLKLFEEDIKNCCLNQLLSNSGEPTANEGIISEKENKNSSELDESNDKKPVDNTYIQVIYNGRLCSIPLDSYILSTIKQQDDIEIVIENNHLVRDDEDNEKAFNINNALRRAYLTRLSKLNVDEKIKENLKRYDEYMEYKDNTSTISVKTMVNELAIIYYFEYTNKLEDMKLIEEDLDGVRLDKGLDEETVRRSK